MVARNAVAAGIVACALSPPVLAAMYAKGSPVLQIGAKDYEHLIARSNHTSIVEFYAPWCGHCQNLKPVYEKAARNLAGLAKVAAVNCEDHTSKQLCADMGIQGFPTLKIVRPTHKMGAPRVEDYRGARTAKAIVDAVVDKMSNHVKRVTDKDMDAFLAEANATAKVILFTEKGATSALLRAMAVDFLGSVRVAQVRSKEIKAVETFGVDTFPTLILLPGGDAQAIVYSGALRKEPIVDFLAKVAAPNPDSTPSKPKGSMKGKDDSKERIQSEEAATSEAYTSGDTAESESVLASLNTPNTLQKECLSTNSHNCILALLPPQSNANEPLPVAVQTAIGSLAKTIRMHTQGGRRLFPVYTVLYANEGAAMLRKELGLHEENFELIVTNSKRAWWKPYLASDYSSNSIEGWVDAIKMGEGRKEKLPQNLLIELKDEAEVRAEEHKTEPDKTVEKNVDPEHDEL